MEQKITLEEKNIEISIMLGWFVRKPFKHNKDKLIVEIYDRTIITEGFGISQNPERYNSNTNWLYTNNLKFHSDWNWLMKAIDFIKNKYEIKSYNHVLNELNHFLNHLYITKEFNVEGYLKLINSMCYQIIDTQEDLFEAVYLYSQWLKLDKE